MGRAMRLTALLSLILTAAPSLAVEGFEARSRHFRVVGSLPQDTAVAAASVLEKARDRFTALGLTLPPTPSDVVLLPDLAAMQPFQPGRTIGFSQTGGEGSCLVVAWNATAEPLRVLTHELAHLALLPHADRHSLWLREGLADLLSNLQPVPGGLQIGLPIAAHLEAVRQGRLLDWKQVLSARREPASFQSPEDTSLFYAQGWLLAHALVVGKDASRSLARRLEKLDTPDQLPDRFPQALRTEILPAPEPGPEPEVRARPLEAWEHELALAELLRTRNLTGPARAALESIRARFPMQPEPHGSLGALEMDALHYDRAEHMLAEAIRLGSRSANTHYRYSLLLMRPLRGTVDGGAESDRRARALRHARRATELDAANPLHWLALAHAGILLSQWDSARASLEQMRMRAADPLLIEQARVELAEIERRREQQLRPPPRPQPPDVPPPPIAADQAWPAASISPAPEPKRRSPSLPGTLTFWGYIRRVECGAEGKTLTVTNRRFAIRVRERSGAPARLHYAPGKWQRLPCSLKDVEVNVVYRPAAHPGPHNGDLVAVVFFK